VTRVTSVVRAQAAGAVVTLPFNLARCDFFQAVGARMHAIDSTNPTVTRGFEVHSASTNERPQEAGSQTAAAGNLVIIGLVRDWNQPDDYAIPISWGIFAQASFVNNLRITGINIDVAPLDFYVSLVGNCLSACPPGLELGKPFTGGFS